MAITYAPWLQPPDFLGAMRSGAEAGLGSSRIRQAAQEMAERTRLGYAQLAAEQNSDMARIAASREAAAINAAEGLRSNRLRESALERDERHKLSDEELAMAAQGLRERHQGFLERQASLPGDDKVFHIGDSLVKLDKSGKSSILYDASPGVKLPATMVTEKLPAVEAQPAVEADSGKRDFLGVDWLRRDVAPTLAQPEIKARPEMTVRRPARPDEIGLPSLPSPAASNIPPAAIEHLRKHPELRSAFDAKYGIGSAASVLGQ